MSIHKVTLTWENKNNDFSYQTYDRSHTILFEGGIAIAGSSAPEFLGNNQLVNPEESFVAALSACHMLTFLAIAAKKQFNIKRYTDQAKGFLERNSQGKLAITRVVLNPEIVFADNPKPSKKEIGDMHSLSHKECFIANSVLTEVSIFEE